MKAAESILIAVLAVAAVGGGAWFLMSRGDTGGEASLGTNTPSTPPRGPESHPDKPLPPESAPAIHREVFRPDQPKEDLPQGFIGVVVDPQGTPIPGARVSLVHGFQMQNFLQALQNMRRGALAKVESSTDTDNAGRFKLPSNVYSVQQPFEVRVEHVRYVSVDKKTELRIAEGTYTDVGRITMRAGNTVQGRVSIEGTSGAPVPGARVRLRQGTGINFLKLPGHESGIEVLVDSAGGYKFENVELGSVELDASAKGYALITKSNVLVSESQSPTMVDFELPKGFEIAGMVVDPQGAPVANAQVTGDAISAKNPMSVTRVTDRSGMFELVGLAEGQYFLSAEAEGFVKADRKGPIPAGERNAQIVLEKQGGVRVFVTGRNGQALRRFTLEMKKFFPNQPENFGAVPDKYPIEVRNAQNGMYLVEGLNPDSYVVQVEAPEHAKKYSEPVTLVQGGDAPEVRIQLSQGGGIAGQLLGSNGQAIAGAEITTRPNNLDENPFTDMLYGLIPKKITVSQAVTGSDGRFRLTLLFPDSYQLRITHKDHYRVNKKDVQVTEGQVIDLGVIKLSAGVRVQGVVYVNGQPKGQVEVTLSAAAVDGPVGHYSEKAITDEKGRFRIDNPLPPGNYEATAARTDLPNPISRISDFNRSKKAITLYEGNANPDVILEINDVAK